MPKIDFSAANREPVPAGTYEAVVTKAKYVAESKATGNPKVDMEFTINDGSEWDGRKLFRSYSCQPNSIWALKKVLVALGEDPEVLSGEVDIDDVLINVENTECAIVLSVGEYQGNPSNQVDEVKSTANVF